MKKSISISLALLVAVLLLVSALQGCAPPVTQEQVDQFQKHDLRVLGEKTYTTKAGDKVTLLDLGYQGICLILETEEGTDIACTGR